MSDDLEVSASRFLKEDLTICWLDGTKSLYTGVADLYLADAGVLRIVMSYTNDDIDEQVCIPINQVKWWHQKSSRLEAVDNGNTE